MIIDDRDDKGGVDPEMSRLDQQAFAETPGGNTYRIKRLDQFQQAFHVFDRGFRRCRNLLQGNIQITVFVEVSNDQTADFAVFIFRQAHGQLPDQVVVKGFFFGYESLITRCIPVLGFVAGAADRIVFVQVVAPVDIVRYFFFDRDFLGGHFGFRGRVGCRFFRPLLRE